MTSHRIRRFLAMVGAGATLAGLVTGCSGDANGAAPGTIDVVASTDVWGDIAAQVGGSRVTVTSIIDDPNQDPHSFEASSRTLLAVRDADLLLTNGGGYDDFMSDLIDSSGTDAPVIDAVAVSGHSAPAGGELNEHVWYDLPTAIRVADAVAGQLEALAPRHATEFTANARAFDRGVQSLMRHQSRVRTVAEGRGVGVTEPVPLYLVEAMGLRNLTPPEFTAAIEDGADVSPRVLSDTLALYTEHRVALLVYNAQTSGPVTEQVEDAARSAGVPVVSMTETLPAGESYLSWMSRNISQVASALGQP